MRASTTALHCLLALLCLASPCGIERAEAGESIANLPGRWAGEGTIVPASGPSETFRCVITYFLSDDGAGIRQNLRCRGPTHTFDAATRLQIADGQVSGHWADNVHSLKGTVSGKVTDKGFDVFLSGQFFEAKMTVVSTRCEQLVKVVPDKGDYIRELAAVLRRC
jgi:hypothetical protein